ncbi:MAG TPA: histidine kinase [Anaerolineales bacterium]|nr:histidine kinase [Anaerolineales bacterium]
MTLIFFLNGLAFGGLGLASFLQDRQGSEFPLSKHLRWLTAFGIACALTSWADMFLVNTEPGTFLTVFLNITRTIFQPLSGLFLLKFGWDLLRDIPLPPWTIFLPGVVIVPLAYVLTYAATNFITPSPLEIPIDIWSRYLFYLPGSILAGIGFLRHWYVHREKGQADVAKLMFGAGFAFLFEAIIVGLVVPAAPYAPSSYYIYNRVVNNAFTVQNPSISAFSGFSGWLDYQRVLEVTGLPIQFWRMLTSFAVTFFLVRALDVFETTRKRQLLKIMNERDQAKESAYLGQVTARKTAEKWTETLVTINRRIIQFDDVDAILLYILDQARNLLATDFIGLALYNEGDTELELKCISTNNRSNLVEPPSPIKSAVVQRAIQRGSAVLTSKSDSSLNLTGLVDGFNTKVQEAGIVRLEMEGRPIGALWAARFEKNPITQTDMVWLECMADQVVIAIQHALMTSQLQSLSISEERARIARDMHDGLAQILGYMNLQVQTLNALLKRGDQESMAGELEQMRKAVKVANADIRENILSLRTTLSNDKGLASSMEEYLYEFGIQTGIETSFEYELEKEPNLSSITEVQMVCIFQESLANVRKHSQAKHVDVRISNSKEGNGDFVLMQIKDDGIGIQQGQTSKQFGITTMKERADSVGGILEIQSQPGKGTSIDCMLPCLESMKFRNSQTLFQSRSTFPIHM